ncbi:hypothetical protein Kpol_544p5 [Vanderwaltozyma polyspora DSM 70294]|uniref:Retrotransposon gag domain-containing protein n=1 Tax=Vanderwaltozyma polyspora (strain ATCC 22028 / DSM 70294 / BCRC 21397 / CBS 2163 / NBRC 10782 / NRRL Y-8283 / UCD 57-17) TaxID=436907 RepID=A7TT63_VANPO|nr:uncharacterized protein Kpol_544p5 [Vanderwaltozyma polyspora DSM 70294]EDO14548.1 hypothetical protein Kpol_544p5 [Vanderwaltozyma polyspora DSM 70294]
MSFSTPIGTYSPNSNDEQSSYTVHDTKHREVMYSEPFDAVNGLTFQKFLRRYKDTLRVYKVVDPSEQVNTLICGLDGGTLQTVMNLIETPPSESIPNYTKDPEAIIEILHREYVGPHLVNLAFKRLQYLNQGSRSVDEYTAEFTSLCEILGDSIPDAMYAKFYINGLRPELQARIYALAPDSSLSEATRLAHIYTNYIPPTLQPQPTLAQLYARGPPSQPVPAVQPSSINTSHKRSHNPPVTLIQNILTRSQPRPPLLLLYIMMNL